MGAAGCSFATAPPSEPVQGASCEFARDNGCDMQRNFFGFAPRTFCNLRLRGGGMFHFLNR